MKISQNKMILAQQFCAWCGGWQKANQSLILIVGQLDGWMAMNLQNFISRKKGENKRNEDKKKQNNVMVWTNQNFSKIHHDSLFNINK